VEGCVRYSVVVPAYAEAAVIQNSLNELYAYLRAEKMLADTEVVVVAADSTDNTAGLAKESGKQFTHFKLVTPGPKVGKGRDVKAGILASSGDYVLFTDADMATPVRHIKPAFETLEQGCDMVIGSRDLWKIHKGLFRKLMSVTANLMVRLLLLPHVADSQCGFKGWPKAKAREVFDQMTIQGWAFDMEILLVAELKKYSTKILKIDDWTDPKQGMGLVGESSIQASIRTFKELWRIHKQRQKGVYHA
jgi:dolichyl-phosphate beta-glucosyltransferase